MFDEGGWTDRHAPHMLSVLRIMTALLFMSHGTSKILYFPETSMSGPPTGSVFWVAGMLELIGGALLAVGLFSRSVAFLLAGEMAVAYFMVHAPESFFPVVNRGETAILYCFIFLYIMLRGPGPWSIDCIIRRKRLEGGPDSYYEGVHRGGGTGAAAE
jgi:putative oxidoreductase